MKRSLSPGQVFKSIVLLSVHIKAEARKVALSLASNAQENSIYALRLSDLRTIVLLLVRVRHRRRMFLSGARDVRMSIIGPGLRLSGEVVTTVLRSVNMPRRRARNIRPEL